MQRTAADMLRAPSLSGSSWSQRVCDDCEARVRRRNKQRAWAPRIAYVASARTRYPCTADRASLSRTIHCLSVTTIFHQPD